MGMGGFARLRFATTFGSLMMLALSVAVAEADSSSPLFPAMFVFGDSLVDSGNNNYFFTLARANMLPNGIDFPAGPTGRFSNGKTIIDVLCDLIGLPYVPPCLAPSTTGRRILTGVNFASAAGGTLSSSGRNFIDNMSLSEQLHYFNNTLSELRRQLGDLQAKTHISGSLFSVVIGSNDYINNYYINKTVRSLYTTKQFQSLLVTSLNRDLEELYALGARKFIVSGIGPLGCIPAVLSKASPNGTCVESLNHVFISKSLYKLNRKLKGACFVYVDAFRGLQELLKAPSSFGFNNSNSGCCGAGKFNGEVPCFPLIASLCQNRSRYIFWDAFHSTQAVNEFLGLSFFNGSQAYARPMNIQQLGSMI